MTELQINCSITHTYHTHTQERMMRLYKIIIIIIVNIGQKKELLDLTILLVSSQRRAGFHYVVSDQKFRISLQKQGNKQYYYSH